MSAIVDQEATHSVVKYVTNATQIVAVSVTNVVES